MTLKDMTYATAPGWFYKWIIGICGTVFTGLCVIIWFMVQSYLNHQEALWENSMGRIDEVSATEAKNRADIENIEKNYAPKLWVLENFEKKK